MTERERLYREALRRPGITIVLVVSDGKADAGWNRADATRIVAKAALVAKMDPEPERPKKYWAPYFNPKRKR